MTEISWKVPGHGQKYPNLIARPLPSPLHKKFGQIAKPSNILSLLSVLKLVHVVHRLLFGKYFGKLGITTCQSKFMVPKIFCKLFWVTSFSGTHQSVPNET